MYEMWETDVGDVGNTHGKQKKRKQEIRTVGSRKQESRNIEKQERRKLVYQESKKIGNQECRKVWKVVKVEKGSREIGKQGSSQQEVGSMKNEVGKQESRKIAKQQGSKSR